MSVPLPHISTKNYLKRIFCCGGLSAANAMLEFKTDGSGTYTNTALIGLTKIMVFTYIGTSSFNTLIGQSPTNCIFDPATGTIAGLDAATDYVLLKFNA